MTNLDQFKFKGKILMMALDHRGTFKKLINPANPDEVNDSEVIEVKQKMLNAIASLSSGILLDSQFGLKAYTNKSKPYLLCIEKTGYSDVFGEKVTKLEYSVKNLKEYGASGVKLLLYFNPYAESSMKQINTALDVLTDCQKEKMPLFLEIVTYPLPNTNVHKPELVLDSVNMFLEHGVNADVYKLEYPGDPAACLEITRLLKHIPWILLTKGDNYDKFKTELKIAIRNGASGFLAGRSLWQDFNKLPKEQWEEYFQTVAKERFQEIVNICVF